MLQSKLFCKTNKDTSNIEGDIGLQLLTRGDFIERLASGIYSFLPLGWRVMMKIEGIIRQEMNNINAQEVSLPSLQPKKIWQDSGRWESMEPPLFKLKDQHKKDFALGPTHEEVITEIARKRIHSHKDLPVYLFQIQTKFRNEMRSTGGLLRTREFIMKDLYSFHSNKEDLKEYYDKVAQAYKEIFKRMELNAIKVDALSGSIGGETSHEFMVASDLGEDKVYLCSSCGKAYSEEYLKANNISQECPDCKVALEEKTCIEAAHIFNLGDKYSSSLNLSFLSEKGEKQNVLMGCYGIGLGRIMAATVLANHDDRGIIWPKEIAPFGVHILNLNVGIQDKAKLEKLYSSLKKQGISVLYDDREDISPGEKLIEADLIGCPLRVIGSQKTMGQGSLELKSRKEKEAKIISLENCEKEIKSIIS